jgi:Tol biopolymer transport system component
MKTAANKQQAQNTPAPVMPTVASAPEDGNAPKPKQPPACTFPLAQLTMQESTPEEYTFSEPQVVLTAPQGNIYNLAEWLPDNQQVLMTEDLRNVDIGNDKAIQQSISLYNPETGEAKIIAFRDLTYAPPSWLPDLGAAVFPAITYTSIDRKNGTSEFTRQVLISYGDPDNVQILADNLSETSLTIKPDGSEMMYFLDKELAKLDKSLKKFATPSFDFSQWDYGKGRRDKNPVSYNMAWQPGTSLVFLYSFAGGTANGGYTFMLDTNTGQVCELDMGGWANQARWSSDGRYLAINRSTVYIGFYNSTDLVVLDTITGNLYTAGIVSKDVDGKHYVSDFTWAPDNRHLLVLEDVPSTYDPYRIETIHHELYLVDFISGQSLQLFPEYKAFAASGSAPWNDFAWSPDGSKLLIRCSANWVDRICFMTVQRTAQ